DLVDARDLVTRMEQPVGELAIVGEKDEPLGVVVEPAHRVEPAELLREEIDDDRPPFRIASARDVATRLVKERVARGGFRRQRPAVDGDRIALGVGLGARLEPRQTVDGDAAGGEERFSSAARRQARARQDLAEPDRRQWRALLCRCPAASRARPRALRAPRAPPPRGLPRAGRRPPPPAARRAPARPSPWPSA